MMRGDKSFAYDLNVQRSIVSSRVALLLRSAEIKLQLSDLSKIFQPDGWSFLAICVDVRVTPEGKIECWFKSLSVVGIVFVLKYISRYNLFF